MLIVFPNKHLIFEVVLGCQIFWEGILEFGLLTSKSVLYVWLISFLLLLNHIWTTISFHSCIWVLLINSLLLNHTFYFPVYLLSLIKVWLKCAILSQFSLLFKLISGIVNFLLLLGLGLRVQIFKDISAFLSKR
jgi:hypothetical protein